ncbi:MAG: hypothetical protein AB8B95_06165 [Pseudohongiellaceae bacterium]
MKLLLSSLVNATLLLGAANLNADTSLLFIGNSFTFGYGSAAQVYRADSVTDLNNQGIGGVPALFKSFTDQAGLDYDVYLETQPGSGIDYHLENKLSVIGRRPWDQVVMHGFSTLDSAKPGNPEVLVNTVGEMAEFLSGKNSQVEIFLTSTWSRADLIYQENRPWTGTVIEKMAEDVRAGYDLAAASAAAVKSVNPVGEAWTEAMNLGIADPNPYDGIETGKVDLWTWDHYHASNYGYYLEALVVFGNVTGLDPRSLGQNECSGYELGMSRTEVSALQQAAFNQLDKEGKVTAAPLEIMKPVAPQRCNDPK